MPQLQLHMLRIAGVASMICDSFEKELDKNSIVSACLLHDMGSIVKFKLGLFPVLEGEKGIGYWEKVKKDYLKKYGVDDHLATLKICKELGVNTKIINIINNFGFSNTANIFKTKNYNFKICVYSDMRVSPTGVTSLMTRLKEARNRYLKKQKHVYSKEYFDQLIPLWPKIEKQIFSKCLTKPQDITEEKVELLIERLRNFDIINRF
ncbi:hypothetical protein A2Z22_02125 [Candidatus Woesebacteria bacterium RBG_16_34_12]|uniref:HD domain-containing protein n=1 Tax=Candidatus Woesebacteria bacterium RBG_16_34_12 TaxID=1802480 RepID=A0A1F7X954_9BACT|nr:MAG: hypothetical protein A2Z22_02125 [Candidatus Woesebacteria bacterium RBG_16_34_12]